MEYARFKDVSLNEGMVMFKWLKSLFIIGIIMSLGLSIPSCGGGGSGTPPEDGGGGDIEQELEEPEMSPMEALEKTANTVAQSISKTVLESIGIVVAGGGAGSLSPLVGILKLGGEEFDPLGCLGSIPITFSGEGFSMTEGSCLYLGGIFDSHGYSVEGAVEFGASFEGVDISGSADLYAWIALDYFSSRINIQLMVHSAAYLVASYEGADIEVRGFTYLLNGDLDVDTMTASNLTSNPSIILINSEDKILQCKALDCNEIEIEEAHGPLPPLLPPEICTDRIDNDDDYNVDCIDDDCVEDLACQEICDDGIDNDVDMSLDCDDFDCEFDPACEGEEPPTGGCDISDPCVDRCGMFEGIPFPLYDCEACPEKPGCDVVALEVCGGGIDDDEDGKVDCEDPDCVGNLWCECDSHFPCLIGPPEDVIHPGGEFLTGATCEEYHALIGWVGGICEDVFGDGRLFDGELLGCCNISDTKFCTNGQDDDGDTLVDCDDPDCMDLALCNEFCINGVDDDGDGLVDCADPFCDSYYVGCGSI